MMGVVTAAFHGRAITDPATAVVTPLIEAAPSELTAARGVSEVARSSPERLEVDRPERRRLDLAQFYPYPRNLHATWDTAMLVKDESDDQAWIEKLEGRIRALSDSDVSEMSQGTVVEWVNESHRLAQDPAYRSLPSPDSTGVFRLGSPYYTKNLPIVEEQLERAAVRLSAVLDRLFADGANR